eukprot:SAG31_NODE_30220_length_384_cov_0.656140_1_plen_109_part_10
MGAVLLVSVGLGLAAADVSSSARGDRYRIARARRGTIPVYDTNLRAVRIPLFNKFPRFISGSRSRSTSESGQYILDLNLNLELKNSVWLRLIWDAARRAAARGALSLRG